MLLDLKCFDKRFNLLTKTNKSCLQLDEEKKMLLETKTIVH